MHPTRHSLTAYKDPDDGLRWKLKIFIQLFFRETEYENFSLQCPIFGSKYLSFRVGSRSIVLIRSNVKHWGGGNAHLRAKKREVLTTRH